MTDEQVASQILARLEEARESRLSMRQLLRKLGFTSDQRRRLRRVLRLLMNDGRVVSEGRGRYRIAGSREEMEGVLAKGARGWFALEKTDGTVGLRIRPDNRGGALPGDRIRAVVVRKRSRGPHEGRVEEVLSRGGLPIVGTFSRKGRYNVVVPDDPGIDNPIVVRDGDDSKGLEGLVVAVRVLDPGARARPEGSIVAILGEPGCLSTELARLVLEHELDKDFPGAAMQEAAGIRVQDDPHQRMDLRSVPHVTIDPPDAKDFDDAVFVETTPQGYRLLVSIADVSAFVRPGGAIDREALRRGCSVYLPGRVTPMLPERLSESLCTLAPGQDRLAVTVELDVDRQGRVNGSRFHRSVIRSKARLTYEEVQQYLDKPGEESPVAPLANQLHCLAECAGHMLDQMNARGALDLDLPEPVIRLDDAGAPVDVRPSERIFANRIVEVFMIAANEAVARVLSEKEIPAIYRVHPPPDPEKLGVFSSVAESLGAPTGFEGCPPPSMLNDFLGSLEGRPQKAVLGLLLLRSLMQAHYSPGCDGHYGLASEAYLHFTSPIRRYPDLVVHRQLCSLLSALVEDGGQEGGAASGFENKGLNTQEASRISDACSKTERKALAAERAATSLFQAAFLQDRIGKDFDGAISFVTDFGVFVNLEPHGIEGMVHISRMRDDYYRYVEDQMTLVGRRTGRSFRMGMRVRVRLESVQLHPPQVDLSLLQEA